MDQDQIKCTWSTPGLAYGVDSVTQSTGIQYADYFHIDCHTRLESFGEKKVVTMCFLEPIFCKNQSRIVNYYIKI